MITTTASVHPLSHKLEFRGGKNYALPSEPLTLNALCACGRSFAN